MKFLCRIKACMYTHFLYLLLISCMSNKCITTWKGNGKDKMGLQARPEILKSDFWLKTGTPDKGICSLHIHFVLYWHRLLSSEQNICINLEYRLLGFTVECFTADLWNLIRDLNPIQVVLRLCMCYRNMCSMLYKVRSLV